MVDERSLMKDLLDLMKVRDKLYGDFKKCKNSMNKDLLFSQFKSFINCIVCLLRTSKKLYYTNFFKENVQQCQKDLERRLEKLSR